MRYRLRTLLILLAVGPPLIGFWPQIKRHAMVRAAQITASDVAVVAATSSLIAIRIRLHFANRAPVASNTENRPADA